MQKVQLGSTGIEVSRLCFGTLTMGPLQRNLSVQEGARLLSRAFDLGVNFLDTAEIYGNYPHIKEALKDKSDAVVSTKCYAYDQKTAQESFEKAVRGIGRDYIDIFLLHEQESEHTLRGHWEAIEFFLRKKQQGSIGALGLSTHFVAAVDASIQYKELQIVHPILNLRGLGIVDGSAEDMVQAVRRAHTAGKSIFAMKPLGGGHLIKQRELALGYVMNNPHVDAIAMGMQSAAEVDYNCALFSGENVHALAPAVDSAVRTLLIHSWCEGCGQCVSACKSGALKIESTKAAVNMEKCVLCGYCAARCPQFCIKVL